MGEGDKLQADKWEIMIIYSNGIEYGKKKKTPGSVCPGQIP